MRLFLGETAERSDIARTLMHYLVPRLTARRDPSGDEACQPVGALIRHAAEEGDSWRRE